MWYSPTKRNQTEMGDVHMVLLSFAGHCFAGKLWLLWDLQETLGFLQQLQVLRLTDQFLKLGLWDGSAASLPHKEAPT